MIVPENSRGSCMFSDAVLRSKRFSTPIIAFIIATGSDSTNCTVYLRILGGD